MSWWLVQKKSHHILWLWMWTRTTKTFAFWGYPPPPHDYPYYWVIVDPQVKRRQSQSYKVKEFAKISFCNKLYKRHTFWSCLIRCANMKWIQQVFLKIQSGHYSVHRWTDRLTDRQTDGQTDKVKPVYPHFNFVEAGDIIKLYIIFHYFGLKYNLHGLGLDKNAIFHCL